MEIFLRYLQVFVVGGLVCFIGQILINKTKMTSARILVLFLTLGVVLEAVGAFRYIKEFGYNRADCRLWGKPSKRCDRRCKIRYYTCGCGRYAKGCRWTYCCNSFWLYFFSRLEIKNKTNVIKIF